MLWRVDVIGRRDAVHVITVTHWLLLEGCVLAAIEVSDQDRIERVASVPFAESAAG